MANSVLCIFVIVLINLLLISSQKILTAIDSSGEKHEDIGTVSPGQWITIICPHTDSIKWSRSSFSPGSVVVNLESNDDIEITNNQLKINKISFKDSGVYYCEQNAVSYRFFLHVLAITKTMNGSVPTELISMESNGIKFNHTKIKDRQSANVSCFCDNGTNNTQLNINWSGGRYDKWSDLYTIVTTRTDTGVNSTLILKKATNEGDLYGEYTCSCNAVSKTNKTKKVYMEVPPIFKESESSIRTVEGKEGLVLSCYVWGYPAVENSSIQWSFQNGEPLREDIIETKNSSNPGFSQLTFTKVTSEHRGLYTCHATNLIGSNRASTLLRVKSHYAALWPFIGILIQLVILIAIIAVYEWKKSQKSKQDSSKSNFESRNEPDALATERCNEPESVRQRLVKT